MSNLASLAQLKAYLGLPSAANAADSVLLSLLTGYSAMIENYCSRTFASQVYPELRDGTGRNRLVLINYPVTAVSAVVIDGVPKTFVPASDAFTAGIRNTDLLYGDGRILRYNGGCFSRGDANILVTYTAGYPVTAIAGPPAESVVQVPPDLAQACIELAALRYKGRDWIGFNSKSLAGETVSFDNKTMPSSVKTILGPYSNRGIPL